MAAGLAQDVGLTGEEKKQKYKIIQKNMGGLMKQMVFARWCAPYAK